MKMTHGFIVSIAVALAACSARQPVQSRAVNLPPAEEGKYGGFAWPAGMPPATRYIHIAIGPDALDECSLVHPHFAFDSNDLRAQDVSALRALANCLNAPGLAGRTVTLLGRADARGNVAYNERLGLLRAERVKAFLVEHGVDAKRIQTTTRGEREAKGDGFYAHGWDRRVDVLVSGTHRPFGATR